MGWFNRDERAAAMGIKQTGVPAGGVFAAVLAGPLLLIVGWRGALAILGIINTATSVTFPSSSISQGRTWKLPWLLRLSWYAVPLWLFAVRLSSLLLNTL